MLGLLSTLCLVAGVAQTLAKTEVDSDAAVHPRKARCNASFFKSILPKGAVLEKVAEVQQGGTFGEGLSDLGYPIQPTNLPALCAVIVNVTSSPTSFYRFGIMLPDEWNHRFLVVGNGGFAGGINWRSIGPRTHYGFATLSTDTGHNSTVGDLSWALNAPEKQIDWGWRSIHGSTLLGKSLTSAYYGEKAWHSYYSGCSTGGRQGLKEVQLFPQSFDGILVGASAWDTDSLNNYVTQVGLYDLPIGAPHYVNATWFPIIADEVIRQCDGVDGVRDGIVSAPALCNFDLSTLQCGTSKVQASACLTAPQIETIKKIYADWRTESGEFLHNGYSLSSEDMWNSWNLIGWPEPTYFGVGYQRYFLYDDPNWQWQDFNDSSVAYARKKNPGGATAAQYDISAYRNRGGKVIMYHGIADGLVPTKGSELYYNRTVKAMGNNIGDFFRLFLIPGMQHCAGTVTNAPWFISGENQADVITSNTWSVPGFKDATHDALLALVEWTEKGHAPNEIIATTWKNPYDPTTGVLRQRPICPYPQIAKWNRRGDINRSSSWSCGCIGSSHCDQ
ncbi:Tannase/feruloyl esterase [Mariannaea sp. PMI_226]|nr:Tannase/feruloyl esterase [Mariannaea sp. PMI_226]